MVPTGLLTRFRKITELFERFGTFNLNYRIAADFDWLLKVFLSDTPVAYLDREIAIFNAEGEHSRDLAAAREERLVVKRISSRWVGGMPVAVP